MDVVVERVLGAEAQRGEDLGGHLHRRLHAVARGHAHHAGLVDEAVRQALVAGDVGQRAAHEALGRDDRVFGVVALRLERGVADLAAAAFQVAHGRRQDHAAVFVGQALGQAVAHGRDERVRGAEVDAHRDATLVRIGGLAGFGNL